MDGSCSTSPKKVRGWFERDPSFGLFAATRDQESDDSVMRRVALRIPWRFPLRLCLIPVCLPRRHLEIPIRFAGIGWRQASADTFHALSLLDADDERTPSFLWTEERAVARRKSGRSTAARLGEHDPI